LEPGRPYDVAVDMSSIAYVVPEGHRLRLAISSTYWPWIWPSPRPVTLRVHGGAPSGLELPVRAPGPGYSPPAHFDPPQASPRPRIRSLLGAPPGTLQVRRDVDTGTQEIVNDIGYFGAVRYVESGLDYVFKGRDVYSIKDDDPLSAGVRCERSIALVRDDW